MSCTLLNIEVIPLRSLRRGKKEGRKGNRTHTDVTVRAACLTLEFMTTHGVARLRRMKLI